MYEVWTSAGAKVRLSIYYLFFLLFLFLSFVFVCGRGQRGGFLNIINIVNHVCLWLLSWAEESSTMNRNTGNLARRVISTSGMRQDRYMQSPKIWPPTFQLIGKLYWEISFHWLRDFFGSFLGSRASTPIGETNPQTHAENFLMREFNSPVLEHGICQIFYDMGFCMRQ